MPICVAAVQIGSYTHFPWGHHSPPQSQQQYPGAGRPSHMPGVHCFSKPHSPPGTSQSTQVQTTDRTVEPPVKWHSVMFCSTTERSTSIFTSAPFTGRKQQRWTSILRINGVSQLSIIWTPLGLLNYLQVKDLKALVHHLSPDIENYSRAILEFHPRTEGGQVEISQCKKMQWLIHNTYITLNYS